MNGTINFNYWVGFVNLRRKTTHNIFHFFANLLIFTIQKTPTTISLYSLNR